MNPRGNGIDRTSGITNTIIRLVTNVPQSSQSYLHIRDYITGKCNLHEI